MTTSLLQTLASFNNPNDQICQTMERPYDDPKPGDEDDPEYKAELFRSFKELGWKPTDLREKTDRDEYTAWLEDPCNEKS